MFHFVIAIEWSDATQTLEAAQNVILDNTMRTKTTLAWLVQNTLLAVDGQSSLRMDTGMLLQFQIEYTNATPEKLASKTKKDIANKQLLKPIKKER